MSIAQFDRWLGALGAIGEDEAGEEEAAAEEVDGKGVEDAGTALAVCYRRRHKGRSEHTVLV